MNTFKKGLSISSLALLAACGSDSNDALNADTVYQNGYIYTSDAKQSVVQAVAVKDGQIVFVGTTAGAQDYVDADTTLVDLENKMMLPGLHDVHIHPTGIVDVDMCDLGVEEMNLDELVAALNVCKTTYQYAEGEMILALQWNSYIGNGPTANYGNLIEALDGVSSTQAVYLLGPDGHSAAANSVALASAKNSAGEIVGLSKTTLQTTFSRYAPYVGVDSDGNPNGYLTESAMGVAGVPDFLYPLRENPQELPKISEKLNKYGITSVQDAWTGPEQLALYKTLADEGGQTFRLTAAQAYDVSEFTSQQTVDYTSLVNEVKATRDSLAAYPFIKADGVKLLMDGVQEGNILEVPPTLPTSVMLDHYKQPIINLSQFDEGVVTLDGYVDTNSSVCQDVRANGANYDETAEIETFMANNNFHPGQCAQVKGEVLGADANSIVLTENGVSTTEFVNKFVSALDKADLTVHMHAVGDGAVHAAIDAIENAKQENPNSSVPHAIAHMQVVSPADQQRLGELGIYAAFTYGWAIPDYYYDLSVMPFLDELADFEPASLYNADNYYMQATYPTKTVKDAGAVLVAGSDAPVDTREPVPFSHMATGMTRDDLVGEEPVALNANQRLTVHDMIAAYTINGAKALRQDDIVGSIEVGKRADLIVIDRNIVELAESENPDDVYEIYDTEVLATIFDGKVVYNVATE